MLQFWTTRTPFSASHLHSISRPGLNPEDRRRRSCRNVPGVRRRPPLAQSVPLRGSSTGGETLSVPLVAVRFTRTVGGGGELEFWLQQAQLRSLGVVVGGRGVFGDIVQEDVHLGFVENIAPVHVVILEADRESVLVVGDEHRL